MSCSRNNHLTPQEYLERERAAEYKSEYWDGEIVAMAGASRRHNRITLNIGSGLTTRLAGTLCDPYVNDLRVRVSSTKYFYPDVVVTCNDPVFEDSELDTLLTPQIVMEVLSPSTQAEDKDEKFAWFRQVSSVTDYITVSQVQMLVEHYARQESGQWLFTELRGSDALLRLPSIGCEVPLSEIYARVTFPPAEEEP